MSKGWCLYLFTPLLVLGMVVDALLLQKRDTSQEPLIIPLLLDQNRYFINVTMSSGSGEQTFNLALSTGTGYTVVAGTDCPSCDNAESYNVSKSTTAQQFSDSRNVSLLGTTASGTLVREDCQLTQANHSTWVYDNQTIIVANQTQSLLNNEISGIVGLGMNAQNGDFGSTIYSQWLLQHPDSTNFTFGMALNPPTPESQSDGGVLHWLAPDTTAYQGDLTWKKLTSFDPTSVASTVSIGKDLLIGLDGWSFVSGKNSSVSQAGGNMIAAMDPFNSSLIFPQDAAHSIYSHVQDAQLLTVPEGTWSVPCDAKMQLTLTFDLLDVVLKEDILIQKRGDICLGTIIQWPDSSASEYFLGSSFISAVYLVFSISGIDGSSIGIALRNDNSDNKFTGGAIAGVVLGGVAFVVAAIISIILIIGKCKKRRRSRQSLSHLRPFTAGLGRDRGFIHDLPSPYSDQVGPTGDGGYVYYDSTPISPSYPLTPRTPPGLASTFGYRAYDSTTVLPITPQISSPTGATTDGISTTEQEVKPKRVLAYTVPVDDSTSQGHHTANHSRSDDNTNSTSRMNVRAGRRPVPLESLPPAYGHWEISDGQATSSGDVTASEQQSRRQRKEKKKRRVVMAP